MPATTPRGLQVQKLLAGVRDRGGRCAVVECTSSALADRELDWLEVSSCCNHVKVLCCSVAVLFCLLPPSLRLTCTELCTAVWAKAVCVAGKARLPSWAHYLCRTSPFVPYSIIAQGFLVCWQHRLGWWCTRGSVSQRTTPRKRSKHFVRS